MLALDEEERMGRWSESDGPKDQIAQVFSLFFHFKTLREPFHEDLLRWAARKGKSGGNFSFFCASVVCS